MYLFVDAFVCMCSPDCCISKNLSLLVETCRNGSSLPPLLLWFSVPACRLSACGEARESRGRKTRNASDLSGLQEHSYSRNLLRVHGTNLHGVRAGLAEKIKQKCVFSDWVRSRSRIEVLVYFLYLSTDTCLFTPEHNFVVLKLVGHHHVPPLEMSSCTKSALSPVCTRYYASYRAFVDPYFVRHSFICCDFTAFLTLETIFKSMQLHETFVCSCHSWSFFL